MTIDNEKKALTKVFRYLTIQDRSSFEVTAYLLRKGYEDSIVKNVVAYLVEKKYINDQQYAARLVKNKADTRKYGIRKIKAFLYAKGINYDIIETTIDNIDYNEFEAAQALVANRFSQSIN
ncbi:MAG: regulatory protein RecX, partial [Bacillota bacterium]|nr:regulatory protein RecX [Bacillota bacterium]